MNRKRTGVVIAAVAALSGVVAGGAALAQAADSDAASGTAAPVLPAASGLAAAEGARGGAPHQHTDVTGAELAKVKAAVEAEDSAVKVETVLQDPDGSYDVFGTKDGAQVMLQVSADLKTVTEGAGGPRGDGHFGDRGDHTPVTGAELAKVKAAVAAEDSAVQVETVQQDPDGSYDVFGTKDGAPVRLEVSADLKTVTQGPPGTFGGRHGGFGGHAGPGDAPSAGTESSSDLTT